jgi:disulfide oxidoreductase YuzD
VCEKYSCTTVLYNLYTIQDTWSETHMVRIYPTQNFSYIYIYIKDAPMMGLVDTMR